MLNFTRTNVVWKNYYSLTFITGILLTLFGCTKENISTDIEMVRPNSRSNIGVFSAGDNEYDLLGYGYDATGEYGNESAARSQVLNVRQLNLDYPGRALVSPSNSQYTTIEAGADSRDYALDLTGKFTGSTNFLLFKGTVYGSYKNNTKTSSKYSYAHISMIIKQKSAKLNATKELLLNYLSDNFKMDVNSYTPQQLVNFYGTHVLTNFILGAKLETNYRAETRTADKKQGATAGATANGILKIFSITADVTYDESLVQTNSNQTFSYKTVGGDGTKGLFGEVELDKPITKVNIGSWQSTCTPQNATLVEIIQDSSIPLHEFITDPIKRQAVKDYIDLYLQDNEVRTLGDVPVYSYYSPNFTDHIYSTNDKPFLENAPSYTKEGLAFYAFKTAVSGTVPVYSYYSPNFGDHIYSVNNKPFLEGNPTYTNEGIAFYAYQSAVPNETIPIYSYGSWQLKDHIYSVNNKPFLENQPSFVPEGIAFHVPK